jgi:pimeloyl-ACP methyl ester carboxylesterase
MTQFVLSTDGTRIAYELIGAARPALVLVYGWSCDRTYWNAQLELSRDFTVVTVDLAGHGESECGREAWSIAAFGSDVALVVTLNGLEDVVLVGHSMGGDVILEAARRLSARVGGLIWVDTYSALPETSSDEDVQRRMKPFRANFVEETQRFVRTMFGVDADPSLVERIARDMSAAPVDVALGTMEAAWTFGPAVPALLNELRLPLIPLIQTTPLPMSIPCTVVASTSS